jgi:predicted metal-dependent TIM-barrel fold hydrolase
LSNSAPASIPEALFAKLAGVNAGVFSPDIDIITEIGHYKPTEGETYLEALFLPNETNTPHLSEGPHRYQGFLQVTVVSPISEGELPPRRVARDVINHFAQGTIIDGDGVRIRIIRQPWAAPSLKDGGWYRTPISIPYYCNA